MEFLPVRRMDLQPNGSWKPIRWPPPCGETRDIPDNVRVHGSVIRRIQLDQGYRPGNLIIGGSGRADALRRMSIILMIGFVLRGGMMLLGRFG